MSLSDEDNINWIADEMPNFPTSSTPSSYFWRICDRKMDKVSGRDEFMCNVGTRIEILGYQWTLLEQEGEKCELAKENHLNFWTSLKTFV